ncbi:AraC family transcriptional regulator [Vibrio sp. AK197]
MHYAIQHTTQHHAYLSSTPRKRTFKYQLIVVTQGMVLCRLGKTEYVIEANQAFWLPFDCLTSLTFFPQTRIESIEISSRSHAFMPSNAGYVTLSPLATALVDALAKQTNDAKRQKLLAVVLDEVETWQPELTTSELTQAVSQWQKDTRGLSAELLLGLKLRESQKRQLSGISQQQVIKDLFDDNAQSYQQICQLMLAPKH